MTRAPRRRRSAIPHTSASISSSSSHFVLLSRRLSRARPPPSPRLRHSLSTATAASAHPAARSAAVTHRSPRARGRPDGAGLRRRVASIEVRSRVPGRGEPSEAKRRMGLRELRGAQPSEDERRRRRQLGRRAAAAEQRGHAARHAGVGRCVAGSPMWRGSPPPGPLRRGHLIEGRAQRAATASCRQQSRGASPPSTPHQRRRVRH